MLDLSPNPVLMGTIAHRTGGISVTASGIDSVLNTVKPEFKTEREETDHHIYLNPFVPLLIIVFLSVEWAIRKRHGMI